MVAAGTRSKLEAALSLIHKPTTNGVGAALHLREKTIMNNRHAFLLLVLTVALSMIACSDSGTKPATTAQPRCRRSVSIATDAYIYGYPLVTMDMTRRQLTNVATPDAIHAPMGQLLKMRTYPPASMHTVTAPNADTLYTIALARRFEGAVDSYHS